MSESRQSAFTLIELIATLAVASILLGFGVPSFMSAIASSRTSADYGEAVNCLLRARSEAVKSGRTTVCARAGDDACGTDWTNGCLVFRDAFPPSSGAIASLGDEDTLLALGEPMRGDNTMRLIGSTTGAPNAAENAAWLTYDRRGGANFDAASLFVCDERGPERSRVANIVLTGDVRPGRRPGGSGPAARIPQDVFGRANDCPAAAP